MPGYRSQNICFPASGLHIGFFKDMGIDFHPKV